MTFVSYAQNFEDVMLWRALKEVEHGFYIDVGANDPTIDSVSKAFYERDWHGINIEPLPQQWVDLERERPNDINLQCAVGEFCGEIDLWEPEIRGWASAAPEIIAMHQKEGVRGVMHKVPVLTLAEICRTHVDGEVHFLKIDVEGHERSVIAGMDFSLVRPWIVVVEATLPNSTVENHQEWEPMLLANGYLHVYADGLNRFYLAKEREELRERFRYPPNVLDEFILSRQVVAEGHLHDLEYRLTQAENRRKRADDRTRQAKAMARDLARTLTRTTEDAKEQIRRLEEALRDARTDIKALHASTSWRITKPLRSVMHLLRGVFAAGSANRQQLPSSLQIASDEGEKIPDLSPWAKRIHKALTLAAEQNEERHADSD